MIHGLVFHYECDELRKHCLEMADKYMYVQGGLKSERRFREFAAHLAEGEVYQLDVFEMLELELVEYDEVETND